jgi:AraC-like DNA-binding protein
VTSLDALAARLERPKRTLQRELSRRGTSHQGLVDEARRTRAQAMLETGVTVAEVSDRLGFSEPSAFFRAFRRWTGETPKQHRRQAST